MLRDHWPRESVVPRFHSLIFLLLQYKHTGDEGEREAHGEGLEERVNGHMIAWNLRLLN